MSPTFTDTNRAARPKYLTQCKICKRAIYAGTKTRWSTNPLGTVHAIPSDCDQ